MDESVLTASRRLLRSFRIDMKKGGLIVDQTLMDLETLEKQLHTPRRIPALAPHHERSLYEAARQACRMLRIDTSDHGGMVGTDTQISFDTLAKWVPTGEQLALMEAAAPVTENPTRALADPVPDVRTVDLPGLGGPRCPGCGADSLVRTGTCYTCQSCYATTGCS